VGNLLWFINPETRNNRVRFGVIRDPAHNARVTEVEARLNITYDPSTETPPSLGLPNDDCPVDNPLNFNAFANIQPPTGIGPAEGSLAVGIDGSFVSAAGPLPDTPPVQPYTFLPNAHFLQISENNVITIIGGQFPVTLQIDLVSGQQAVTLQTLVVTTAGPVTFQIPGQLQPFPVFPAAQNTYLHILSTNSVVGISNVHIVVRFASMP
jgi:hypothetical protein